MPSEHLNALALVRAVLGDALRSTYAGLTQSTAPPSTQLWASGVRLAWIGGLHDAFVTCYAGTPNIAVFSGVRKAPAPMTWRWNRQEYLYDVTVIEAVEQPAPYAQGMVPVVVRHLWQVECEMAQNATQVAEDLGKLTGGAAPCKLLVTKRPQHDLQPWLHFIEQASAASPGHLFLAMMPSYSSSLQEHHAWLQQEVAIDLFWRPEPGKPFEADPLGQITAAPINQG